MTVDQIAIRQEVRQLLSEAGITKTTIKENADAVLREEIDKQIKNILNQSNLNGLIYNKLNSYESNELLRNTIRQAVREAISVSVDVKAEKMTNPLAVCTELEREKSLEVFEHPGKHIHVEKDGTISYSADMVRAFEIAIELLTKQGES